MTMTIKILFLYLFYFYIATIYTDYQQHVVILFFFFFEKWIYTITLNVKSNQIKFNL